MDVGCSVSRRVSVRQMIKMTYNGDSTGTFLKSLEVDKRILLGIIFKMFVLI